MGTTRTINTFNEGMAQDVDKLNQPNAAYRYSKKREGNQWKRTV